ncbi:hypothetical protein KC351_g6034 [Hortaea werneckii]|nr:hypothetical protein KC351_g6034 [Hortaea werneckii]
MFATWDTSTGGATEVRKETPRAKRKQFSRACDWCRLNRVKCNENEPCDNCAARGQHCVTGARQVRTVSSAAKEIERLKGRIRQLEQAAATKTAAASPCQGDLPIASKNPLTQRPVLKAAPTSAAQAGIWIPTEAGDNGIYRSMSSIAATIHRSHAHLCSALQHPNLANPFQTALHSLTLEDPPKFGAHAVLDMPRHKEECYLQLFWQSYHLLLPMLNLDRFMEHYRSLWADEGAFRRHSALVDVVLALCIQYGECFARSQSNPGSSSSNQGSTGVGKSLLDRARNLLPSKDSDSDISSVQCHLLAAIYLANDDMLDGAHESIVKAHRLALSLGLQHEPPAHVLAQDEAARRYTWWSLVSLDTKISLDVGQPFLVNQTASTCSMPAIEKAADPSMPRNDILPVFGISPLEYYHHYVELVVLIRSAHEGFVTQCAEAMRRVGDFKFYENARVIEECADSLAHLITPIHQWVERVPDALKTPRAGSSRPFSTARSALDLGESTPSWLQRQRVMLELSYHTFLMLLHRPMIRFPTGTMGRIPVSSEHSVWSLNHAVMTTNIIHQVLTESDVLGFVQDATAFQWDAVVTMLAFALGHPFCPHTPSAHGALRKAITSFETLGTSNCVSALQRAESTRAVMASIESISSDLSTGSSTASSLVTPTGSKDTSLQIDVVPHAVASAVSGNAERFGTPAVSFPSESAMDMSNFDLLNGLDYILTDQDLDTSFMAMLPMANGLQDPTDGS